MDVLGSVLEERTLLLMWCTLNVIAGISIISIFVYHVYRLLIVPKFEQHWGVPVIMNMVAIFFFFIHTAFDTVSNILFYTESFPLSDEWCFDYTYWRMVVFELAKFSLYFVWITQMYISYKGSSYQYSVRFVVAPLYMFNVLFLVLFTSLLNFHVYEAEQDGIRCSLEWNWGIVAIFVFFDTFFNVTTCILFIRPLTLLLQHRSEGPSGQDQVDKLVRVIVKKIILLMFAILSTYVFVPIELFLGIPLIPIDDAVNSVCILMMLSLHREMYHKCCAKVEKKMVR